MADASDTVILVLTSQIVAAHVKRNQVPADSLADLIHSVHTALASAADPAPATSEQPEPAVPIKRSVFPDYIVCLEDGKQLKMLKRHLMTAFNLTPAQYRERWGLPLDYPMTAPNYGKLRSTLARSIGLGRKPSDGQAAPDDVVIRQIPERKSGTRKRRKEPAA